MSDLLAYLNGRFVPERELVIGAADAGFVFGATVTDFCRTYRRQLFRWPDHLARLRRDCDTLGIPLVPSDREITEAAERLVEHNAPRLPTPELALIAFATPGPLAHLSRDGIAGPPTLGMHTLPLRTERYRPFFVEGVTLHVIGPHPADPLIPTGVKHRNRLHWWQANRLASDGLAVLLGDNGAPDTAIGSLLVVADGCVYRPRTGIVLEGISLQVVAELCSRLGLAFAESDLDFRRLDDPATIAGRATEVLLTGSGFGLAGVCQVNGAVRRSFPWPGPVTKRLQVEWSNQVGVDIEEQMLGRV